MSKAVLISIRPEWCEKIVSGEKTIEVRKTRPKMQTPFKCYIYMTKQKKGEDGWLAAVCAENRCYYGAGSVIGEFVCDEVETYDDDTIHAFTHEDYSRWNDFDLDRACMHPEDFEHYASDSWLYGWHISDLVIYDNPKELSEFEGLQKTRFGYAPYKITRPPQSWCYVEDVQ